MNVGHENMTKSVWKSRFIQILVVPFWLKNTAEKMTSLQMCLIKKITPHTGQTFWDRQLCFYVKKLFISEKPQKNEKSKVDGLKKFVQYVVLFFWFDTFEGMSFFQQYFLAKGGVVRFWFSLLYIHFWSWFVTLHSLWV